MQTDNKPIVLAVDEDEAILDMILASLKNDYNVKTVTSGEVTLEYLSYNPVDLILMDTKMPDLSGHRVFEILQSDTKTSDIPFIFLTNLADESYEAEALERSTADYVVKPIKPPVLLKRVYMQLEQKSSIRRLENLVEENIEYLRLSIGKVRVREDTIINLLTRINDLRDDFTGDHIKRIPEYVSIIVKELLNNPHTGYELTESESYNIINSAKLHDLGKIAIPEQILRKPDRLEWEEFKVIKQHPFIGACLIDEVITQLEDNTYLKTAREIAISHHEKWDGQGYPQNLKETEIPISARIVTLADVYDALTHKRPYKPMFSHEHTIEIIKRESGKHFDPYIVQVFLENQREFEDVAMHAI